jgi:hypothetical protein
MVELSVRIVVSGALVFFAGISGLPPFATAIQLAAFQVATAYLTNRIGKKGLRTPAVSALVAAADSIMIAFALAACGDGVLETYAISALAPIIFASAKHNANPFLTAPLSAMGIVAAYMANHSWRLPTGNVLGLALTFLAIGCLVKPMGKAHSVPASEVIEEFEIDEDEFYETDPKRIEAENQLVELRESYRTLRDEFRSLDRKSRKYKVAGVLAEAKTTEGGNPYFRICEKIREASGSDGILLYTVTQSGDHYVVRGSAGNVNETQLSEAMQVQGKQSIALIREKADQLSNQFEPERPSCNILLQNAGKIVGILTVIGKRKDDLFEALESLEPCADLISSMVTNEQHMESIERRLNETEVLYAVVANATGAHTKVEVATRIARDFQSLLQLEHIGIHMIEGDNSTMLAHEGRPLNLMDGMTFAGVPGIQGWMNQGAVEFNLIDARASDLLSSELLIKERIGSVAIIPIGPRTNPMGFISAASGRVAGIDTSDIETLRSAAVELGRIFERPDEAQTMHDGILSPGKFVETVGKTEGVMVSLIPLHVRDLESKYGKPAMIHALRTMTMRIRPYVPTGAMICRHPQGMFLVYLPGYERDQAQEWANEIIALNPGAGIRTPDGSAKIPLQLRVKVAALSPQFNQFLVGA